MYDNNGNQYNNQQFNSQPVNNMGGVNAPDYMLWLILGIAQLVTMCCCNCTGLIFGGLTVFFAVKANNKYKVGDAYGHQHDIKIAKILNIVGWVLMFGGTIINFVTGTFTTVMESVKGMF